jgi:hypothetical protein
MLRKTNDFQACSSVYGKITMILLVFRGTAKEVDQKMIQNRYARLFQAFGDRVTFVILANGVKIGDQKNEQSVTGWFQEALQSSHLFPTHHVICVETFEGTSKGDEGTKLDNDQNEWAQDAFVVLQGPDGLMVLLEPMLHTYVANALVAEQLASTANILLKPTRYRIEGGNILVGDDFALIGKDLLEHNRKRFFSERSYEEGTHEVTSTFKELLGVKYLIWTGMENAKDFALDIKQGDLKLQQFFHIDLFITLGGKDAKSGHEVIFIAKIDPATVIYQQIEAEKCLAGIEEVNQELNRLAKWFEKLHGLFAAPQFSVERMPMGLEINKDGRCNVYSYNNCHVEWYHGIRRIHLPRYPQFMSGAHDLESKVNRLMKGLGYQTQFIEQGFDVRSKFEHGSLHCLTKVLSRTNY